MTVLPRPAQPAGRNGPAAAKPPAASTRDRFSAWRDQVRQNQPQEPLGTPPQPGSLPAVRADPRQSWRDEIVTWTRAVVAGAIEHNAPTTPAIDTIITRFELALQLQPALVLLYGAHLCGDRGVAPIDLSRVLDRQWDEALGRGELAQRGATRHLDSRVTLAPAILRVLDELPPSTGTLIGEPGPIALLGPCVIVAAPDEPITATAERCVFRVGGAILAAHATADPSQLMLEARAYGAAPLLRFASGVALAPSDPAIFIVPDTDAADQLALPRLA